MFSSTIFFVFVYLLILFIAQGTNWSIFCVSLIILQNDRVMLTDTTRSGCECVHVYNMLLKTFISINYHLLFPSRKLCLVTTKGQQNTMTEANPPAAPSCHDQSFYQSFKSYQGGPPRNDFLTQKNNNNKQVLSMIST